MTNQPEPKQKNGYTLLKFGGAILLILFLYVMDWSFIGGGITAYEVVCPQDYKEGNGCYALSNTTYYSNKSKQVVILKSDYSIETLKKCTVIDNENWECSWDDESATFGFNNGQFHNYYHVTENFSFEEILKREQESRFVPRVIWLLEYWNII